MIIKSDVNNCTRNKVFLKLRIKQINEPKLKSSNG